MLLPSQPNRIPIILLTGWLMLTAPFAVLAEPAATKAGAKTLTPDAWRLQQALEHYRQIDANGGWPAITSTGPTLRAGERHDDVVALRNRLRISGDFQATMQADPYYFSAGLADAVRRFQARHGLFVDGIVERSTRRALNVSLTQRIEQLQLNLRRWQDLPLPANRQQLLVNSAGGYVELRAGDDVLIRLNAIAGTPERPTPELQGQITRLILNPSWTVPKRIAVEDLLPLQQRDRHFFSNSNIRVFQGLGDSARETDPADVDWAALHEGYFPYWLRQDPGPDNSLGRIKFHFANQHDVYLHDTPNRVLFKLPNRTFSSGCVRVENAMQLAEAILQLDGQTTAGQFLQRDSMQSSQHLTLASGLPITIAYLTSWVTEDGAVHFTADHYGHDQLGKL